MRLSGHYQPPTIKYKGREQLKSTAGSCCRLYPPLFWEAQLQSASCLTPARLLHLGSLCNTSRYAYGVSASASKIAATEDTLWPVLCTVASQWWPHSNGDNLRCPGKIPVLLSQECDVTGLRSSRQVREGLLHLFCTNRDSTICYIMTQISRLSQHSEYVSSYRHIKKIHCACLGSTELLSMNF